MRIPSFFLILIYTSSLGCAAVGNFFLPPHSKSDKGDPELTCLYLEKISGGTEFAPILAAGAAAGIGFLVDRVAASVEEEASRYNASYSARARSTLILDTGGVKFNSLRLVRFHGEEVSRGCKDLQSHRRINDAIPVSYPEKALELIILIKSGRSGSLVHELKASKITINKTKAKVREVKWFVPWSWWMLLHRREAMVDLKTTIKLSAMVQSSEGLKPVDLIASDLKLGKFNLDKDLYDVEIKDSSSGWFAFPSVDSSKEQGKLMPITASVSLTEADDLGDVIGKAGKKITENKQAIVNVILESLETNKGTSGQTP